MKNLWAIIIAYMIILIDTNLESIFYDIVRRAINYSNIDNIVYYNVYFLLLCIIFFITHFIVRMNVKYFLTIHLRLHLDFSLFILFYVIM